MKLKVGFEFEFLGHESRDTIRRSLETELGLNFYGPDSDRSRYKKWHVKNDRSVMRVNENEQYLYPHEIVSPILDQDIALRVLPEIFNWMQRYNFSTNSTCGLHLNVSFQEEGLIYNLDKFKLIMLSNEDELLTRWNRTNNAYCRPHNQAILTKPFLKSLNIKEVTSDNWNSLVDFSKYRTINFSKLNRDYLEFRSFGGQDYHLKTELVLQELNSILNIMKASVNKTAALDEYQHRYDIWINSNCEKTLPLAEFQLPGTANPRFNPMAYRAARSTPIHSHIWHLPQNTDSLHESMLTVAIPQVGNQTDMYRGEMAVIGQGGNYAMPTYPGGTYVGGHAANVYTNGIMYNGNGAHQIYQIPTSIDLNPQPDDLNTNINPIESSLNSLYEPFRDDAVFMNQEDRILPTPELPRTSIVSSVRNFVNEWFRNDPDVQFENPAIENEDESRNN